VSARQRVLVPEHRQLSILRPVPAEHQDSQAGWPACQQVDDLGAILVIGVVTNIVTPRDNVDARAQPQTRPRSEKQPGALAQCA